MSRANQDGPAATLADRAISGPRASNGGRHDTEGNARHGSRSAGDALHFADVEVPLPCPGQVLVRVEARAVCRTDLHVVEGELAHPKPPLMCAGLIGYRTSRMAGEAARIGIYGFGAAAHIAARVCRHEGREIHAFTRPGDTLAQDFARQLTGGWAGGSDETPPEPLDAALIFAPPGDLVTAALRATADLGANHRTVEEREEYEPHIAAGNLVFAGVDYAAILSAAEKEADIIVWDGGNNDFPFTRPDFHIVVADASRPGQIATHHPGEAVARMADLLVINKVDAASPADIGLVTAGLRAINPSAPITRARSPVRLDPVAVKGRRVLVVEDGPTITHGGMSHGAGFVAATAASAAAIVDPRLSATPEVQAVFRAWPHIGMVLPATGYDEAQLKGLAATIRASSAEVMVSATPIDLGRLIQCDRPIVRA